MSAFGGVKLTNKGLALIAKAQTGVTINFTRIAMGSGSMSGGQTIPTMTALIDQKKNLSISKLVVTQPGTVVVGGSFSNADITTGFTFRELGLFAQDPDEGEILFSYGNAGVNGELIPPGSGGGPDILERHIDINVIAGSAANITSTINSSLVYVTVQDFDTAMGNKVDKVTGKGLSTEDYTSAEKIKLAGIAAGANNYQHPSTHPPSMIQQDASNRFVTDVEKTGWNAKAGTSVATTAANGLMAATDKQLSANRDGYGITEGSATAYTVTLSPAPTLVDGLRVTIKLDENNGTNPTLNVNGLGAKAILKPNGAAPAAGLLKSGSVYSLVYNGTAFILQGEGGEYGTAVAAEVLAGKTIGTETGIVIGTMPDRSGDTAALSSAVSGTTLKLRASDGYRDGTNDFVTLTDADFIAANIRNGVNLFGLSGSLIEGKPFAKVSYNPANISSIPSGNQTIFTIPITGLSFMPKYVSVSLESTVFQAGGGGEVNIYNVSDTTDVTTYEKHNANKITANGFVATVSALMSNVSAGGCTITITGAFPFSNNSFNSNIGTIILLG